ncbi:BlaI/MecI/CopY family transcriptional regulator [Streptomyces sp. NPDC127190]|uniref:BlaI/MecI/CopY family transcriptional regulator n=1 Tax=unclassified Streptomyces TaxID=2593676 RepID=UPI003633A144
MAIDDRSAGRRPNGQLEAEILTVLQRSGSALSAGQVMDRLDDDLTYSTVITVLNRLYDKQVLSRTRHGRAYVYAPVADEAGLAARRMQGVLDERGRDREAVLSRFVDGLSSSDEELLRQLLDQGPGR